VIDQLTDFLLDAARPEILKVARADSCILSTRVAVGVCRRLHVSARALPVKVVVFNPAMCERLEAWSRAHDGLAAPDAVLRQIAHEEGSWCCAIGFGPPPGHEPGYDGHLVALVNEDRIIDLSIDQLNRDAHGIRLRPLVVHLEAPTLEKPIAFKTPSGCVVTYRAHENDEYLRSRNWHDHRDSRPLVDALVRGFKDRTGIEC
jgi:hypothetical protein